MAVTFEHWVKIPQDTWVPEDMPYLNYLKGAYLGQEERIKELEEKFSIALHYQREKDARLVEQHTIFVDHYRTEGGRELTKTESLGEPLPEIIRGTPLDD